MSIIKVSKNPNTNWKNDHLQFARLLAEMVAAGVPNEAQMQELSESMDLPFDDIHSIMDRAQAAWDDVKEQT